VQGKVIFTKGGSVVSLAGRSAAIEFESIDQPEVHAYGSIQEDGSFTMATPAGEAGKLGAVAGRHRVRLALDDAAQHLVAPQFLDFQKSGITVKVPSDQPIEIKVWR